MLAELIARYHLGYNWLLPVLRRDPALARLPVVHVGLCDVQLSLGNGEYLGYFGIPPRRETSLQRAIRLVLQSHPFGAVLNLQPASGAGKDTFIASQTGYEDTNYGTQTNMYLGATAQSVYRVLIQFPLTGLPSNAAITNNTFSLYSIYDYSTNARTCRVFRSKRAWTSAGATWHKYDPSNTWQTEGGFGANDCEQTDIGSRAMGAAETINAWKDFTLTPTTKSGLDLGNGWLLKVDTEVSDAYTYASSEGVVGTGPKLVITYNLSGGQSGGTGGHGGSGGSRGGKGHGGKGALTQPPGWFRIGPGA